jgi:hypothetical protein
MPRVLITFTNSSNEFMAEVVDGDTLDAGPTPLAETLVENWDSRRLFSFYGNIGWPPEYAYRATDRQDPDAEVLVYVEAASGDFAFLGAVACTLVEPFLSFDKAQQAYFQQLEEENPRTMSLSD